jgi:hypothetical protein
MDLGRLPVLSWQTVGMGRRADPRQTIWEQGPSAFAFLPQEWGFEGPERTDEGIAYHRPDLHVTVELWAWKNEAGFTTSVRGVDRRSHRRARRPPRQHPPPTRSPRRPQLDRDPLSDCRWKSCRLSGSLPTVLRHLPRNRQSRLLDWAHEAQDFGFASAPRMVMAATPAPSRPTARHRAHRNADPSGDSSLGAFNARPRSIRNRRLDAHAIPGPRGRDAARNRTAGHDPGDRGGG